MLLHILESTHIRVQIDGQPGLEVHGEMKPVQMLAASLALCTASVMNDYAATAQFKLHESAIDVRWNFSEQPRRVGQIQMTIEVGPHVPPDRQQALLRAAEHCTVHNTLTRSTHIEMTLEVPGAKQA